MSGSKHQDGFTLIELSIVLVIISLLVGGVLVGNDLIEAAKLRKDQSLIQEYDTAANTFRLKYNYLPGDLPNAATFGFDAASSGDGNKRIQLVSGYNGPKSISSLNATSAPYLKAEWFRVFHHLGEAGLVNFDGNYNTSATTNIIAGTYYPEMANVDTSGTNLHSAIAKPGVILSYEQNNRISGHFFRMGAVPYPWSNTPYVVFLGGYTPAKAKRIDLKFDDGLPVSGKIQIGPLQDQCPEDVYDTSTAACESGGIGTASAWHCAVLSTGEYDVNYNARICSLRVKASF